MRMDKEKISLATAVISLASAIINLLVSLFKGDQESRRRKAPQPRGTFLLYPLYHDSYEYTKGSFHYFYHRVYSFASQSGISIREIRRRS